MVILLTSHDEENLYWRGLTQIRRPSLQSHTSTSLESEMSTTTVNFHAMML